MEDILKCINKPRPIMSGSVVKRGRTYSIIYSFEYPDTGKRWGKWVGGYKTKFGAETALEYSLATNQVLH
jgi:hypothetical protein